MTKTSREVDGLHQSSKSRLVSMHNLHMLSLYKHFLQQISCIFFSFSSSVFRTLRLRHPVPGCVLHGPLGSGAAQPPALHAHAQAHHHPGLQHGQLRHGEAPRVAHLEAPGHTDSAGHRGRSNRGRRSPPDRPACRAGEIQLVAS